jgi:hypothetical protein
MRWQFGVVWFKEIAGQPVLAKRYTQLGLAAQHLRGSP